MPHCYIASDSGPDSDFDSASAPAVAFAFAFAAVGDCGRHWRQRQSIVCIFSVALSVDSRENRGGKSWKMQGEMPNYCCCCCCCRRPDSEHRQTAAAISVSRREQDEVQ